MSPILTLMIGCSSGKAEDSGGDTASSDAASSADEGNWWEDGDGSGDTGKDEIFEVDGLGVHALYGLDSEEGEIWEEVLGGYSVMHEGVWYFGLEF